MGQTLSEPITNKATLCAENDNLKVGKSSMQGWRVTMEDSHTVLLQIPEDPSASFFGVFDGHGGARIAHYAGRHLYKYIVKQQSYASGNITKAIEEGFMELDSIMKDEPSLRDELAGSTAVTIILKGNKVYCGNAGDSRAIAVVNGETIRLSNDHKPTLQGEYDRIIAAGGWVEFNRVNGNLALSRALGDYAFKMNSRKSPKEQVVTACPEVIQHNITEDWEFIVMACDGIWDVMRDNEVAQFVRERLDRGLEPETICEELMTSCLAPDITMGGIGSDNMTVIIIVFTKHSNDDSTSTDSVSDEEFMKICLASR